MVRAEVREFPKNSGIHRDYGSVGAWCALACGDAFEVLKDEVRSLLTCCERSALLIRMMESLAAFQIRKF